MKPSLSSLRPQNTAQPAYFAAQQPDPRFEPPKNFQLIQSRNSKTEQSVKVLSVFKEPAAELSKTSALSQL